MSLLSEVTSLAAIQALERPAVLDFGAEWCGPCKQLEPTVQELAKEYGDRVFFGKVDIDAAQELTVRLGVMSVPTLVFLRAGQEVERVVGVVPRKKLRQKIEALLVGT